MHTLPRTLLVLLIFLLPIVALAQTVPVSSTNYSGTITTTNSFQPVQGQTNNRQGCTIQNNGTHTMYVFFGPAAAATTGNSFQLAATQAINCNAAANLVLKDAVNITGTSGDAFTANFQ